MERFPGASPSPDWARAGDSVAVYCFSHVGVLVVVELLQGKNCHGPADEFYQPSVQLLQGGGVGDFQTSGKDIHWADSGRACVQGDDSSIQQTQDPQCFNVTFTIYKTFLKVGLM